MHSFIQQSPAYSPFSFLCSLLASSPVVSSVGSWAFARRIQACHDDTLRNQTTSSPLRHKALRRRQPSLAFVSRRQRNGITFAATLAPRIVHQSTRTTTRQHVFARHHSRQHRHRSRCPSRHCPRCGLLCSAAQRRRSLGHGAGAEEAKGAVNPAGRAMPPTLGQGVCVPALSSALPPSRRCTFSSFASKDSQSSIPLLLFFFVGKPGVLWHLGSCQHAGVARRMLRAIGRV